MKKILSLLLSLLLIASLFSGCSGSSSFTCPDLKKADICVASFNCAAGEGSFFKGTSDKSRIKKFAEYMNTVQPDSIGAQEINSQWLGELSQLMSFYDSYSIECGGDDKEENEAEMNAVFWLRDKFECVLKDTIWLTETPEKESRYEGAGGNRICSYVMLRNMQNDKIYLHMNTQLDDVSAEAREFAARAIRNEIERIKLTFSTDDFKIVLTGDFNDTNHSKAYRIITETLADCSSASVENNQSTYNGWGKAEDSGEPVDYIFTDSKPVSYAVLNDTSNGYVSDHYGVCAAIDL